MVERVARALCAADGFDPEAEPPDNDTDWRLWRNYTDDARAAIEAIRPPKKFQFAPDIDDMIVNRYIDAALNEGKSSSDQA